MPLSLRRVPLGLLLALASLAFLASPGHSQEPNPTATRGPADATNETIVFWIFAHPDDETLAAGRAIAASQAEGNQNVVILATTGENTHVRERLELTREQVIESRKAEVQQAMATVGVTDVRFLGHQEGVITEAMISALVDELLEEAGERPVAFRGHSPSDPYAGLSCGHEDHCVIGRALLARWRAGDLADVALYRIGHLMGERMAGDCHRLTVEEMLVKREMLAAYTVIDPENGRHGIGHHSVGRAIENAAFMPECVDRPRAAPEASSFISTLRFRGLARFLEPFSD